MVQTIWKPGRFTKSKFQETYKSEAKTKRVSWHHENPTAFLKEAAETNSKPTRALDIGCGLGTDSVYLAQLGWNVTAIDFVGDAVNATRKRAAEAGVEVNCSEADIFEWTSPTKFDLIVDAGCMHNLDRSRLQAYKAKVLNLLSESGDLVLAHWESRHPFDWRPVGPHRVPKSKIEQFLAPELALKDFQRRVTTGLSFVVGPTLSVGFYWFQRSAGDH